MPKRLSKLGAHLARGCLLACLFVGAAQADDTSARDDVAGIDEGNGAVPVSPEAFAKLPKTASYRAYLPLSVDLSKRFPVPGDQGAIGSCTAWAVGYAARGYYSDVAEGRNTRDPVNIPSPGYIYGAIAIDPGKCDSGSKIVDALNLLRDKGAASIKAFPTSRKACHAPTSVQRAQASDFKIGNWLAVDYSHLDQIKGELAKGHPVIVSLRDTKALHRLHGAEVYQGGTGGSGWHAIVFVGYDEARKAFRAINSWGTRWGDHGFGWIAYSTIPTDVREAYVMRPLAPVLDPPTPVAVVAPAPSPAPSPSPPPVGDKPAAPVADNGCSKLNVMVSGKGMARYIAGFTDSIKRLAQAQPKADISKVQERPWPQCEVLQTLGAHAAAGDRPKVEVQAEADHATGGTLLKFVVRTPAYPSFIHLAYLQADGSVVNLVQPSSMTLHAYPPNSTIVLGDPAAGGPTFHVSPPYGREMLVVTSSRSPLFDAPLPAAQNARDFLTQLREALLARPDTTSPDRVVTAGFDSVITSDKGIVAEPAPSGM